MSESPRIEEIRRRVQGDPASIAFAALAEEFRRAGRFKEAVETTRAGLRHHPTYVSARVTLGRSLVELQEFEQAERELAFVLRSAPDNLAARRALGELCWQRLRFADALIHFKAALVLAPRDTELPGVISSLERELESERAAAAGAGAADAEVVEVEVAEVVEVAAAAVDEPVSAANLAMSAESAETADTVEAAVVDGDTVRMPAASVFAPEATPVKAVVVEAMVIEAAAVEDVAVEAVAEQAAVMEAAAVEPVEAVPVGAGKQLSGAAAIAALERFYRTIVRTRDAKPPAAPRVSV